MYKEALLGILAPFSGVKVSNARIFIVDDNADVRFCYGEILRRVGYIIYELSGGQATFDILETEARPDLIILDLEMPEMDGFVFLAKLRQDPEFASIPIILSSGHFIAPEITDVIGVHFLAKPNEPTELLELVRSVLDNMLSIGAHVALSEDSSQSL